MKKSIFFLLALLKLHSQETVCPTNPEFFRTFEFFGTLLEVNKTNINAGKVFTMPLVYGGYGYGFLSPSWSLESSPKLGLVTSTLQVYVGLSKEIELDVILGTYSCFYKKKESTALTDTLAGLCYQFLFEDKKTWMPNFRVLAYGIFPTGKGSNLGDHFDGTNASGLGAYGNQLGFCLNKIFKSESCHPFALNLSCVYSLYYQTKLKGVSSLGGSFQTKGIATPGSTLSTILSLEYVLIPHLFLCFDLQYLHTFKSKFKGTVGLKRDGSLASIFTGTRDSFTLCPALEYSVSSNLALYLGGYFVPFGRNSLATAEGVISAGYEF